MRKHLTVSTKMIILQVPAQLACSGVVQCMLCATTVVPSCINLPSRQHCESSHQPALHSTALQYQTLQIFSFHGNISIFFLLLLVSISAKTSQSCRARGDDVVEKMPAENENKDLAHNFLHKEFSLRVTMLGSLACRTSSTRLLLSSYSSLYFNNHDSIPSSNLSKHLVV